MPIRTAAASDREAIYRLGYDAWGEGLGLDDYLAACRVSPKYAAGAWWVHAREDGFVESSLLAHEIPLPSGAPAIGLGSIATAPELRGQGRATRLIAEVIRRYEATATTEVFFLFSDISPAFYERFGFSSLQPSPKKPASILMIRCDRKRRDGLFADARFKLPNYF